MRILFLAPQPFFQDRGTPIAVRLAVQVLARRDSDAIDLLTYHEGQQLEIPNVRQTRIRVPAWVRNIRPGISFKKLLCDLAFFITAVKMVWRARREPYDLLHAVEESVFVAWCIKRCFGIPYIYDMDSSLALQVTEKWFLLKPLFPLLQLFEGVAVRGSTAVVPVCDALALIAEQHGSPQTQILRDISLLDLEEPPHPEPNLRTEAGIPEEALVVLYVGNLEKYQGIDLLVEGLAQAIAQHSGVHLVIIGGADKDIARYQSKAARLGISDNVSLIGRRPLASLRAYLQQADILTSPRTRGNNTPMKIYPYLHSGTPVIATALPTHTQVLNDQVAVLAEPTVEAFASGLSRLIADGGLREQIGAAGHALAEEKYTYDVFRRDLNALYDRIGAELVPQPSNSSIASSKS